MSSKDADLNRRYWDAESHAYQERHARQLNTQELAWGVWAIPESELGALGEVADMDILELGCGAAQWSIFLAKRGARPVALDNSQAQLDAARRLMSDHGVDFELVHASADNVPLPDQSFDIVFCDHGGMSFADPKRTVPEAHRLLRPGGLLVFNMTTPLTLLCWDKDQVTETLHFDYFGLGRFEHEGNVEYNLTYGEWIRLFRTTGFIIEDLIEIRPPADATTTYDLASLAWARRWPAEQIWKVRRQ